jgi:hypothetical protein
MTTIEYNGEKFTLRESMYASNGAQAIIMESEVDGAPYAKLSTNVDEAPADGCFWLKDWSENEPIAAALLAQGVIELTGRTFDLGHVIAKEAKLS